MLRRALLCRARVHFALLCLTSAAAAAEPAPPRPAGSAPDVPAPALSATTGATPPQPIDDSLAGELGDDQQHADLPPNHPAIRGARTSPVMPDPRLPSGTINVRVIDEERRPLDGARVVLEATTQSVIEGKSQRSREATASGGGTARFDGVDTASTHTYRVIAERGSGRFSSPVFSLPADRGYQVLLQAFPTSTELAEVQVATGLLVYLVPRTDAFQFELLLEVDVGGKRAWRASEHVLTLPVGAGTFTTEDHHGDARLVATGREVRLEGTLVPGRQRLGARFAVSSPTHALLPFAQQSRQAFGLGLPPRLARLTLAAEPPLGADFSSPQLPPAVRDVSPNGANVMVLSWDATATAPAPERVEFALSGLPTRGALTSLALLASLALLGGGFLTLFGGRDDPSSPARQKKLANAVMSELLLLEKARKLGLLGPEAHARLRRRFLALYARLTPQTTQRQPPRS